MKRLVLFLIAFVLTAALFSHLLYAQDEIRIWKEFVASLKKGEITPDKLRPYAEFIKPTIIEMLKKMREMAAWQEWEAAPEIYPVGNKVHFLILLTYYGNKVTYCFTFVVEGKNWYFVQPETILVRMDRVSSLPTSIFPDTTEDQKAWMREEIRISELVYLFNFLAKEKGKDFAFNWFRDGYGYFVAAQAQVPFVPERKAFILYLCWEQANLRGQKVTLEKLEDNEAIVRILPFSFQLYQLATHLKPQISFEDYHKIFETIWQDRAEKAGWNLQISYEQEWCLLHFKKAQ